MKLLKNIFLTDDDPDDWYFFRVALNEIDESINCDIAKNGKEALSKLKSFKTLPDVIFLDLNMPVMNGFECLSKIKADGSLSKLPVVIFTTSTNPSDVQSTHQLGADVFLIKPSNIPDLVIKLQRILYLDFNSDSGFTAQYSI
jgi:CheY-like chemotaxis protein